MSEHRLRRLPGLFGQILFVHECRTPRGKGTLKVLPRRISICDLNLTKTRIAGIRDRVSDRISF